MKEITYTEKRYYITEDDERLAIKHALHGQGLTLADLAEHLRISYGTLWAKLNPEMYDHYFLEKEWAMTLNFAKPNLKK
jgi:DNA-binding transcriptional MerR regulator